MWPSLGRGICEHLWTRPAQESVTPDKSASPGPHAHLVSNVPCLHTLTPFICCLLGAGRTHVETSRSLVLELHFILLFQVKEAFPSN